MRLSGAADSPADPVPAPTAYVQERALQTLQLLLPIKQAGHFDCAARCTAPQDGGKSVVCLPSTQPLHRLFYCD